MKGKDNQNPTNDYVFLLDWRHYYRSCSSEKSIMRFGAMELKCCYWRVIYSEKRIIGAPRRMEVLGFRAVGLRIEGTGTLWIVQWINKKYYYLLCRWRKETRAGDRTGQFGCLRTALQSTWPTSKSIVLLPQFSSSHVATRSLIE